MGLRFDSFEIDFDARELRLGGRTVALTPKAFDLLRLLVEARPRAISKSELYERLWPDVVVVEANLANLVVEVRAALGEDGRNPRFIRTLHRFGYAFREAPEGPAAAAGAGTPWKLTWKGGRARLAVGEHLLGRDPELELCFGSDTVSRRHARLLVSEEGVVLEDLGSKNGTFVAGARLEARAALADGDEFQLGSVRFRLRRIDAELSTRTRRDRAASRTTF